MKNFSGDIHVDSGTILIGDVELLKSLGLVDPKVTGRVKPGVYRIRLAVECWNNPDMDDILFADVPFPSGEVFIGDPCYFMPNDRWITLLKETNHLMDLPVSVRLFGPGGDGRFPYRMSLARQEDGKR